MFQLNQEVANTRYADRLHEARQWRRSSQFRRPSGAVARFRQLFRSARPQLQTQSAAVASPC